MPPSARPALVVLFALAACSAPVEVCRPGEEPHPTRLDPAAPGGLHAHTHSHNDYEQEHPLEDALAAKFHSVEADAWFAGGAFEISHLGISSFGTLRELYLEPLQKRVDDNGSIYGDDAPFFLVIDLKDFDPNEPAKLEALLAAFPMLTTFEGSRVRMQGAVEVILTGEGTTKEAFTRLAGVHHATRDSNDYRPDDPENVAGWSDYALSWGDYLDWDGTGEMPADQRRRLGCIVENAHAKGRRVRLFGGPDRAEAWKALVEAGTDFVQTDHLAELSSFLDAEH